MNDNNNRNVQHPFRAALAIFNVAVRTAFDSAAAFWRPWYREPERRQAPATKQSKAQVEEPKAPSEEALQPPKREQEATVETKPKAPTKRTQQPKPLTQEATVEKKPKAPTKRSLKHEQELEREERAQKTERLRKLRLAKEAAERESSNGRGEAQDAAKE